MNGEIVGSRLTEATLKWLITATLVLVAIHPTCALAAGPSGEMGTGWPPEGDWAWKAVARHGGTGYQLGVGSGSDMGTANLSWTQDETYHFALDYATTTDVVTFTVTDGSATQIVTHTVPGANGRFVITAKTDDETGNYAEVLNVTVNGDAPSGADGCRAEATSGTRDIQHLLITDVDLSQGFLIKGDFRFNWGSSPKDESPAIQMEAEYTDPGAGATAVRVSSFAASASSSTAVALPWLALCALTLAFGGLLWGRRTAPSRSETG